MNSSLQQLANLIQHEAAHCSPEQLSWHPEGKWSIAEILEHLSLSYTGTTIVFNRCKEAGQPSARVPTAKDRAAAFLVTRLGYLPSGRQAPRSTVPKGRAPEQVLSEIVRDISAMECSIEECEELFGRGKKLVDHPILGPLSADEWRRFHCIHGRHHLRQIRNLKNAMARS